MSLRIRYGWVKGLVQRQPTLLGSDHDPNPPLNLEDIPSGGATEELASTSAGASSSSGALTRARALAATSAGTSGESAALTRSRGVTGASAGSSASSGALGRGISLGSVTEGGSGSDAALLTRYENLSGTDVSGGGETAALTESDGLQAVSSGGSTSDAGLSRVRSFIGGSVGESTDMAELRITSPYEPPPDIPVEEPATVGSVYFDDFRREPRKTLQSPVGDDEMAAAFAAVLMLI